MDYIIDENDFKCPYCQSKSFRRNGKSSAGKIRYLCINCNKSFTSTLDVKTQEKYKLNENDFRCPFCENRKFLRNGKLPSGKFRYLCLNCYKNFSSLINTTKKIYKKKPVNDDED